MVVLQDLRVAPSCLKFWHGQGCPAFCSRIFVQNLIWVCGEDQPSTASLLKKMSSKMRTKNICAASGWSSPHTHIRFYKLDLDLTGIIVFCYQVIFALSQHLPACGGIGIDRYFFHPSGKFTWRYVSPHRGIKPQSSTWQSEILSPILMRSYRP